MDPGGTLRLPDPPAECWVYSLNQHKIITSGEGGWALTFDDEAASRIHLVRNHGESVSADIIGYNYRMTEPTAKIARAELTELKRRLFDRRVWAADLRHQYDLPEDAGNEDWYLYAVRVPNARNQYAEHIKGARVGYQPLICDMPYFKERGASGPFPNARQIESEIVVISPEAYNL